MTDGFGISFYGFFVFAALWCVAYFAWALAANRKDATPRHGGGPAGRDDDRGTGRQPASTPAASPDDAGGRAGDRP